MTPCGFYLLHFCDLVCLCVGMCECARMFPAFMVQWLKFYAHMHTCVILWISPLPGMCARKSAAAAVSAWHRECITFRFTCLAESNGTSHLLDVIVKNQRISHALPFFPPFRPCIWIYFIIQPQHVWQGVWCVCDGEILDEPWRNVMLLGEFAGP